MTGYIGWLNPNFITRHPSKVHNGDYKFQMIYVYLAEFELKAKFRQGIPPCQAGKNL